MSRRQAIQTAEGVALCNEPYGIYQYFSKSAPVGGEVGFAPGCEWFVEKMSSSTYTTGTMFTNIGSNGYSTGLTTANPNALWLETDPSSGQQFQFGGGAATMLGSGNIYRKVSGVGLNPAATSANSTNGLGGAPSATADYVVDFMTLPANSLDGVGNRGLTITASGNHAANTHVTESKIVIGSTLPVIGSTISTGVIIADSGSNAVSGGNWLIQTQLWKYGAANSNTQIYQQTATIISTTHSGTSANLTLTQTENVALYIYVTLNAVTTATDISLWWWDVQGFN